MTCGLARLVGDVGRHLDDLAWSVTLHVRLGLQHHGARFHQHVAEVFGHRRRGDSLEGDPLSFTITAQMGFLQISRD